MLKERERVEMFELLDDASGGYVDSIARCDRVASSISEHISEIYLTKRNVDNEALAIYCVKTEMARARYQHERAENTGHLIRTSAEPPSPRKSTGVTCKSGLLSNAGAL